MASAIDATKPTAGSATTQSVRDNFSSAESEISALQAATTNIDNTSDANKPVSTATQTALDLKADLAGPTFTGTVVLPATTSIGTVTAAEVAYVSGVTSAIQTQLDSKDGATAWAIKTTTYTAVSGDRLFANSNGGTFTITLPLSPTAGDAVTMADYSGDWATNNVTVGRNSQPIVGLAEDLVLDRDNASIELVYIDGTQGWRLV